MSVVVKPMRPRFKALPAFNITATPRKPQRIKQYLDSGTDYTTAVRKTDADFKAHATAQAAALKAQTTALNEITARADEALKDSADYADEEARALSVG